MKDNIQFKWGTIKGFTLKDPQKQRILYSVVSPGEGLKTFDLGTRGWLTLSWKIINDLEQIP